MGGRRAGNQSPDPLIDFYRRRYERGGGWESVTRPLDRLRDEEQNADHELGISHQTP